MIDYGLKDKVAIITGANNPWGDWGNNGYCLCS